VSGENGGAGTAGGPPEATGRDRRGVVAAKEWVTPRMLRITFTGDLDDFRDQGTDQHVALKFHPPEAIVPPSLRLEEMQALAEFAHTFMRRYTVRRWDPATREVDFDFFVHEPLGLASRWALEARVGDELVWWGPTPAWRPGPDTARVVLVGDETALPAIDAVLAGLDPGVEAVVVAEVADGDDEAYLAHHADRAGITWVHRAGEPGDGSPGLLEALAGVDLGDPAGTRVWGAAEFATVGALRRFFHGEHGMSREQAFLVTYWTRGRAQDARYDARGLARTLENRRLHPERAGRFIREL
jgi:NADPH-dependent ferric siderophore reductase